MATETQETIADIIAEMRQGMNPNGTAECQYLESDICMLADRLEAALERELSKNTSKNGADFGQLGDAAKLREALATIRKRLVAAYESEAGFMRYSPNKPLVDLIDAALTTERGAK